MSKDFLDDREKALETEFFRRQEQELLGQLRARITAESEKRELADELSVSDPDLLDELVKLGIEAETITAMSLVPIIAVGWADGKLDDRERDAILSAAVPGAPVNQPAPASTAPAIPALTAVPSSDARQDVSRLLAQADDQTARLALTVPSGDNALETYQQVLAIDPHNEAAQSGIELIGMLLMEQSRLATGSLMSARPSRATRLYHLPSRYMPKVPLAAGSAGASGITSNRSPRWVRNSAGVMERRSLTTRW